MFRTGDVKREDTRFMPDTLLPYKHKQASKRASGAKLRYACSRWLINSTHSFLVLQLGSRDGYVIPSVREFFCYTWNDRNFIKLGLKRVGPGYRKRYSELLRAGRSGIESPWGRDFLQPSRPALGPTSHPYNGYRVSFPGLTLPGLEE